ncbi:hypothetical protein EW146_g434 [Bondarzewia mesenterica]|uniref:Dolichyl-diphosphooligosaccharide--protein glycosyltransferase subunit OST2 n=1 Tax=Bondarzewia mesenterica TaxID=1095465 RepID=A0A4S4M796_9AGAM|nr:hypothetical protein EW146_g434 [Bondarzewia mesenterica]
MAGSKAAPTKSTPLAASSAVQTLWKAYIDNTSSRLKFVDSFLVFLILSGVLQFMYCVLVTSFPFNAFLAGFASTVGQFVLTASLRSQANPDNRSLFKDVSPERCVVKLASVVSVLTITICRCITEHLLTS